tara:strand:+ start:1503 stop:1718 length:216 start_codon:yes stop_codon:yes gene_type:complete
MKKGVKTSEFYICLVVLALGALMQSGVISDGGNVAKITGGAMEVLAALGYTWSRATIKLGPQLEEDEIEEE